MAAAICVIPSFRTLDRKNGLVGSLLTDVGSVPRQKHHGKKATLRMPQSGSAERAAEDDTPQEKERVLAFSTW